MQYMTVGY